MDADVINQLARIVGEEHVLTSIEDRVCYSYDATNQQYRPDVVVFPDGAGEISSVLKLANEKRFPVVPRGAGSGFTGGSLPVRGGAALVLTRMNRILEIDENNLVAVVEPGVVTADFQNKVEKMGLFYPPDPASLAYSTLGGNVAECAGGPRATKYGVTRDYVLGLEVVLPTGGVVRTGSRTVKSVVGYDLTRLMVGSEGTLGVITRIVLRLIPLPEARKTLIGIFPLMGQAAQAVSATIRSRIIPSTMEFLDNAAIRSVEDYLHLGLPVEAGALLLIEVDGKTETLDREAGQIESICMDCGAERVEVARDDAHAQDLWKMRRSVSASILKLGNMKINEDVTVPRSRVPDLIQGVTELARKYRLNIVNFGHAGDGNIHVNIMVDRKDTDAIARAHKAVDEIFGLVLKLEGTISGEHGIGITKAPYMSWETGTEGMDVMRRIKQALDPLNILNPGKMFDRTTTAVHHESG
ncbi:MAG: FAD-binding protein [Deltaproteobacteria bacterium]|nr:FAD-binding protein [Deltaproteobacteria bacterium]MBW2308493.1 FAD-binding protein [Deltaproteobacteria bacterium]